MSESARGEGGRVWVPKIPGDKRDANSIPENDRWYFLEEWYPKYGNLVPRDVATRAIHKVVYEHHLGIDGKPMVYLDLTHVDRKILDRKLEGILEIYEKFVGDDPRTTPMKIFPGMHYTMGGYGWTSSRLRISQGFSRPENANTSITALTGWERIRWSPASSEALLPAPQRCSTRGMWLLPRATGTSRQSASTRKKITPY